MKTNNIIVFAPLRGWYHELYAPRNQLRVFAPLRGWYKIMFYKFEESKVFAPLRGEPSQSRLTPCQLPRKGELGTG